MAQVFGVCLLPATNEFVYDTVPAQGARWNPTGGYFGAGALETEVPINCYYAPGGTKTDYSYAIDQLQAAHPECQTVAVVVAWFGSSDGAFLRFALSHRLSVKNRLKSMCCKLKVREAEKGDLTQVGSGLFFKGTYHEHKRGRRMHRIEAQRGAPPRVKTLAALRGLLAKAGGKSAMAPNRALDFSLGAENVDAFLGGGLSRACLHEIHAPWGADGPAAAGFGLGLALRAAPGRPVFWVRQDVMEGEGGRLNGMGLAEFGVDPAALSLVRGKDAEAVLRAGVEAARCKSLGAALIEIFGAPRALDLTATLRLARAAEVSGVTVFLLRIRAGEGAKTGPPPSAAASRWQARAHNSRALLANAPGAPCFSVTLLRHRGGAADRSWRLEWQRDRGLFHEAAEGVSATLSGALAALPVDGKVAESSRGRRAG